MFYQPACFLICITMIAATGCTLAYRAVLFMNTKGWWSPLHEKTYSFLDQLDPSVFGVAMSCLIFAGLSLNGRFSHKPPVKED